MYQPFLHLYSFSYRAFLILSEQFSFSVFSVCGASHRCARPPAIGNVVLPAAPRPHDYRGADHLLTYLPAPIQMGKHSFDSPSLPHLISFIGSPDQLPPHIYSYHHKAGNDHKVRWAASKCSFSMRRQTLLWYSIHSDGLCFRIYSPEGQFDAPH